MDFLIFQRCQEHLVCYRMILFYKNVIPEELRSHVGNGIWNSFLGPKADQMVNIPASIYGILLKNVDSGNFDCGIFDLVEHELLRLMEMNSWTIYRTTPFFEKWLVSQGISPLALRKNFLKGK